MGEYLNIAEAATLIGRTPTAIYRMVARRQIPHRKYGRRLLLKRTELLGVLDALPGVSVEAIHQQGSLR